MYKRKSRGPLWNSKINFRSHKIPLIEMCCILFERQRKIKFKPVISYFYYSIMPQLFKQDLMINCVKCFLEVNKNSACKFVFVECIFNTINNGRVWIGITFATFSFSGKIPVANDILYNKHFLLQMYNNDSSCQQFILDSCHCFPPQCLTQ